MPVVGLLVVMVALASPPGAASPSGPAIVGGGKPDSPTTAVRCLARAYSQKSLADYAALLTADYRFHFSSRHDFSMARYIDGFGREHELQSASSLFNGVVRNGLVVMPAAESIATTVDGISEGPDPEHRDSTAHYRVVTVRQFMLSIRLAAGDNITTRPDLHVFHLVRGDAAVCAEGQPADPDRWYVRRWLEDVDGLTLAIAADEGRCGEPAPKPAAPSRRDEAGATTVLDAGVPADLAIHPLGNPACPTLDLTCDLPGSEPARIEVFDVTGRLVNHRPLPATAPGTVRIEAGIGARLAPGIYWVRLSQAARKPSTKMVVVAR